MKGAIHLNQRENKGGGGEFLVNSDDKKGGKKRSYQFLEGITADTSN